MRKLFKLGIRAVKGDRHAQQVIIRLVGFMNARMDASNKEIRRLKLEVTRMKIESEICTLKAHISRLESLKQKLNEVSR